MSRVTPACSRLIAGTLATMLALTMTALLAAPAHAEPTSSPTATRTANPSATGVPASDVTTSATADTPLSRAAGYVVSSLADGDHVVGPYGADLGQSVDVALGLAAAGGQDAALAKVVAYLDANAAAYVHGDPARGERATASYAGPTAKLALLAWVTDNDPTSFAGADLLSELRALMAENGQFVDVSEFGDYSNPLGQAFAVLALERATTAGAPQVAVDRLAAAQCDDGGFPAAFAAATCVSSPDATGLALQALVAADADCPAARALAWLTANQSADGSYVGAATDPATAPAANVNSTAYAALGLTAARASTTTLVSFLGSTQNPDGGLPTVPSTSHDSDVFATAQALAALARSSLLAVGPRPVTASSPTCAEAAATVGPASTAQATAKARPPAAASAGATSTPSASSTTIAASATTTSTATATATATATPPTDDVTVAGVSTRSAPPPPPPVAASGLPQTGADMLTPVAVGFVLLFLGLTVLLALRRPAGRHS